MAIWEQQFDTQCRIRRAVIVHGDVQDIFWDDATGQTGVSIVDHLRGRLERLGYTDVVRWDSHDGASAATEKDSTSEILATMVREAVAGAGVSSTAPKTTGKTYDLCYCNQGSPGFDPDRHFAFLRGRDGKAALFVANFSSEDSSMHLRIPADALDYMGAGKKETPIKDVSVKAWGYSVLPV